MKHKVDIIDEACFWWNTYKKVVSEPTPKEHKQ